jgi:hypothetical protein
VTLFFANHEITIYRSRRKGTADKFGMSATFTAYAADIQPSSDARTEFSGGQFGSTFTAFVESSVDIKEGDYIHTSDGKVYAVKGVRHFEGAGMLDHTELLLTSQDA